MTLEQITIDQALAFINKQQHKVKFMKDYLAANSKGRSHFISLVEALSIDVTVKYRSNRLLYVSLERDKQITTRKLSSFFERLS